MITPTKASKLAQKVAGTLVEDAPPPASALLRFFQQECRSGRFSQPVQAFARAQAEFLDPALVLVEAVSPDGLTCCIPSRQCDHESGGTFLVEVRFTLDPETGATLRVDAA